MKHLLSALAISVIALQVQADSLLIKGADVYTADSMLAATDVFINDGKIAAVGKNLSMSADKIIDGNGKSITAGLFNSYTQLGAIEVGAIEQTSDFYTERTDITAALKVADAFNPQSTLLPYNRAHGLTQALLVPESGSGLFSGQVALVQLGETPKVVHDSLAIAVDFTEYGVSLAGNSRASALVLLRQNLQDAKDFSANKAAALAGDRREYTLSMMDLAALEPVIKGQKPLIVRVNRASDITKVLALSNEFELKLILAGVKEGWMVAQAIAGQGIPVIMDPIENLPGSYESLGARLDNAKLLSDAGVTLMFTGMSWHNTHNAHLVRQSAGNAVANGLSKQVAIAAMTVNPSRWFKSPVSGDIRQGGVADLVLWSGDPLEVTSIAELVIAAGVEASQVTRATMLRDRYFERLSK